MNDTCPCANGLECNQSERNDEFYRQMSEAMLVNRPITFVTGGLCPAYASDCMKLREYKESMRKQQQR